MHRHMINTLSNVKTRIALMPQARAICSLTIRDILPYMFDNSIIMSKINEWLIKPLGSALKIASGKYIKLK